MVPGARSTHAGPLEGDHRRGERMLKELRPHMRTLVDGFAIPDTWLHCAILREEPRRQETMSAHDAASGTQAVPV